MKTNYLELCTDYLIINSGFATATGLSAMMGNDITHDQVTRFLASDEFDSKRLWLEVKKTVIEVESEDGYLIFDDTVQEKAWTDENEIMCWHYDHCKGRSVKGLNILNALYYSNDVSIPVAFEIVKKPILFSDLCTRQVKRKSEITKNEMMRDMIQTCLANQLKFRFVLLIHGSRRRRTLSLSSNIKSILSPHSKTNCLWTDSMTLVV